MTAEPTAKRKRRTMNERFPDAAELIRRDYEVFTSAIRAIAPPEDHGWGVRRRDLDFWRGDAFASSQYGNDTRLTRWWNEDEARNRDARTAHEDQIMITVRVFIRVPDDARAKLPKGYDAWRRDRYRAYVYGKHGNQFAFEGTDLPFTKAETHPEADSIGDLLAQVRPTVEKAIADFNAWRRRDA